MNKFRCELKFMISEPEALKLKQIIKNIMKIDENADEDGKYLVRSLYFDDAFDTAYRDKLNGIQLRKKYRIRTYGQLNDKTIIKAECKFKQDAYIAKTSVNITREELNRLLRHDYDFLLFKEQEMLRDYYAQFGGYGLRPKVIVDYEREAYVMREGNVRVTFDHSVRAGVNTFDILSSDVRTIPVFPPNVLVMEVKYDEFLPNKVRNVLKIEGLAQMAVSKYIYCRMRQFV